MIFLLLSILTSTFIFIVFKLVSRNKVNTFQTIVVNYLVCVLTGCIAQKNFPSINVVLTSDWFIPAVILGSMFISVFYITALTVRYGSMAIASIANKLSLIIPATVAFFLYGDEVTIYKVAGILLALVSVVLTSYKKENGVADLKMSFFIYPALVLLGSGLIDAASKFCQVNFVGEDELNFFLITVFGTSAFIGTCIVLFKWILRGESVKRQSLLYGILLGVPNYASMYFLIAALAHPMWNDSSTFFPINNISIVIATAFCGRILFQEKLRRLNFTGIVLAVVSIALIAFGS